MSLDELLNGEHVSDSIFHMHASRQGPLNSNEIYLSIAELKRNPRLRQIIGLQQPNGLVSKYLSYWLSGLDSGVQEEILSNIRVENSSIFISGVIDLGFLNKQASSVYVIWDETIDALMLPILNAYEELFSRHNFDILLLEKFKKGRPTGFVTFEDVLNKLSLYIVNFLLSQYDLPLFKIEKIDTMFLKELDKKYIDLERLDYNYKYLLKKKEKQYNSAYLSILKQIKTYNGHFPSVKQFKSIYAKCTRNDSAFARLEIDEEILEKGFLDKSKLLNVLPVIEQVKVSVRASEITVGPYISNSNTVEDFVRYVDGENMVKAMFKIADNKKYTLILQEFIRGTDYKLYKMLIKRYPQVVTMVSACKIWDLEKHDVFDQNLVTGIKYLDSFI